MLTPGMADVSFVISFIAWPELFPGAAWPCTSNDGNPKKRSSVVGVVCQPVLAKDEKGTIPPWLLRTNHWSMSDGAAR